MEKSTLEVIQTKVNTLKFIRTHVRWAGIVAQLVGFALSNTIVMIIGTFVFFLSYLASANIIEEITVLVWEKADEEKNEDAE